MSGSKVYRVAVRLTREWIVFVSAPDAEIAEEHACDIPEDALGEPLIEDLDAEVQPGGARARRSDPRGRANLSAGTRRQATTTDGGRG